MKKENIMEQKAIYQPSPFDAIRHLEDNQECWYGRELQEPLGYVEWRNFEDTIQKGKVSCQNSGSDPIDHFVGVTKLIEVAKGGKREIEDYKLSRFACYLTAMNGDPRKPEIAAAQSYFAIKTREAEIAQTSSPRKLAPCAMDLDLLFLEKEEAATQKSLWHYRIIYLRKVERRLLKLPPEPKEEPVKVLPVPKPQPTIEEAVMEVLASRVPKGEKRSARKISQLGNTFLRKAGSPKVWIILEIFHAQGRVEREGYGRGALYGLSVKDEKGVVITDTLGDAS